MMNTLFGKRVGPLLAVSAILLGAVIWMYPDQAPVMMRKAAMVTLGLWTGYVAYKAAFPREPEDSVTVLTCVKAALMVGVALCYALAV